jgi:hypothetical protein
MSGGISQSPESKYSKMTIGKAFKFLDSVIEKSHALKEYPISSIIRSCVSHWSVLLIGWMTWKTRAME